MTQWVGPFIDAGLGPQPDAAWIVLTGWPRQDQRSNNHAGISQCPRACREKLCHALRRQTRSIKQNERQRQQNDGHRAGHRPGQGPVGPCRLMDAPHSHGQRDNRRKPPQCRASTLHPLASSATHSSAAFRAVVTLDCVSGQVTGNRSASGTASGLQDTPAHADERSCFGDPIDLPVVGSRAPAA